MSEYINKTDPTRQQTMKDEALDKWLSYVLFKEVTMLNMEHWLSIFNYNFLWVTTNTQKT